jgi:phage/plasmid primase-like uncharacterized protein
MNISRPIADWIDRARAVPIEAELERRGVRLKGRGRERAGPCLVCGGTDRFSINTHKAVFNCRGCQRAGDVIAMVQHVDDCSFGEACETLTGEPPPGGNGARAPDPEREQRQREQSERLERDRQQREAQALEDECRQLERAGEIWNEARAIIGTTGEGYLIRRGIVLDDVPEGGGLRFHPACPWELSTAACVLARYTDVITGEPRGIWRRPISGEKPKAFGSMSGCVIRLWPDDEITEGLVIGEGIETTLAAATRIEHHGTLLRPAWAAGCAGNLESFPILPGIEALTILVDHDASGTGQRAAEACAQRWCAAGREVIRLMPGNLGTDFNDTVKS